MSYDPSEISCSICDKPVDLETAKIDDKGKAVHAECYFLTVVKQFPSQPITRPPAS